MPIYRCVVSGCPNQHAATKKTVFACIPKNDPLRSKWLKMCKKNLAPLTQALVCEKHFNMEEDFENYLFVKLMGGQLKKKIDTVPSKFPWNNWGEMKTVGEGSGRDSRSATTIEEDVNKRPTVRDFGVFCNLDSITTYCEKSVQTDNYILNDNEAISAEEPISSPIDVCEVVFND